MDEYYKRKVIEAFGTIFEYMQTQHEKISMMTIKDPKGVEYEVEVTIMPKDRK